MTDVSRLPLAAAYAAINAGGDLLQIVYEGDLTHCRALDEDTIPQLADALKMTIEHAIETRAVQVTGSETAELLGQLQAALVRFLEGWA